MKQGAASLRVLQAADSSAPITSQKTGGMAAGLHG
jgi:hypothetical protein